MFTPAEITKNYIAVAKTKTTMRWYKILVLAVLAGAFIALGGALSTVASAGLDSATARLVKGAVFPLGLMLVVVCGAELFTGNCLLVAPAINRDIKLGGMFKNLGIVYVGNLVGGVFIAALVVGISCMSNSFISPETIAATASAKAALGFGDVLLRGILCNILVCLAVWAAMASKSTVGKIVAIYLPVFAFVVCGFEHSVADMYYLSAGLMTGKGVSFGYSVLCLLAATIGNIIGGALIAIAYNVVYGKRNKKAAEGESEKAPNAEAVSEAAATDDQDN